MKREGSKRKENSKRLFCVKRKTLHGKWLYNRQVYGIPDHIPDSQVKRYRYLILKKKDYNNLEEHEIEWIDDEDERRQKENKDI